MGVNTSRAEDSSAQPRLFPTDQLVAELDSDRELLERFGSAAVQEAAVTSFHEIRPRLYLGSIAAALDPDEVHTQRLTHVVNCLHDSNCKFRSELPPPGAQMQSAAPDYVPAPRLTYLALCLQDVPSQQVLGQLPAAVDFIRDALSADPLHRVLVHCMAGVSRSATVVVAYLMTVEGLSAARALAEVQAKRCCCNPNSGFRSQLKQFEARLQHSRAQAGLPPLRQLDHDVD